MAIFQIFGPESTLNIPLSKVQRIQCPSTPTTGQGHLLGGPSPHQPRLSMRPNGRSALRLPPRAHDRLLFMSNIPSDDVATASLKGRRARACFAIDHPLLPTKPQRKQTDFSILLNLRPIRMGPWRTTATAVMLALPLLALLVICHLGQASADNVTLVVKNSRSSEIIPRVVIVSPGPQRIDYPAVQSDSTRSISLEHDSHSVLFFATGCSRINHQVKCISGDCPQDDCVNEVPVATTMIDYNNATLIISVGLGYNIGVKVVFQGLGCDRSSISCVLPRDECLESEKMWQEPEERGQPRVLVACKSVSGLAFPPGQDCVTDSYDHPPSAGASCDFKNGVWQVTVS